MNSSIPTIDIKIGNLYKFIPAYEISISKELLDIPNVEYMKKIFLNINVMPNDLFMVLKIVQPKFISSSGLVFLKILYKNTVGYVVANNENWCLEEVN